MFMPPPPEAFASSTLGIYEEHAPHLVSVAPYMLEMFRGHEELLLNELKSRYLGKGRKRARDDEDDARFVHYMADKLAEEEQEREVRSRRVQSPRRKAGDPADPKEGPR